MPLNVVVGDKVLKENEIDNKWYYAEMASLDELPTTSQPSIGDYILLLESLYRDGYTDVISFHLSAELSGTCQNARAAAASVDGINVHVVDSEIAAAPLGFMALYAAQNIDKKPLEEILADADEMKKKRQHERILPSRYTD
ncbi:DegV family protein [Jeotgalicoccus sp. WY2]|uniref:DegV family protein n=1 Tax=Jeotgalicoccus sp. WY2 TaxID=2708346 RepID=UPI00353014E7